MTAAPKAAPAASNQQRPHALTAGRPRPDLDCGRRASIGAAAVHRQFSRWFRFGLAAAALAGIAPSTADARPLDRSKAAAAKAQAHLERQLVRGLRQLPEHKGIPEPLSCGERLARMAQYIPIASPPGAGACGAVDLVRLDAIRLDGGGAVAVEPAAVVRCAMAEAVARLVREEIAPAVAGLGARASGISTLGSYECRTRNNLAGARPSEHGRGNALDIGAITLADGRTVGFADRLSPLPFRARVRDAACKRFDTVLGPGADAFHDGHVHLDLAGRKSGYRICQWDLEDAQFAAVPLPRPRPLRR
jgi:hypothetical protein